LTPQLLAPLRHEELTLLHSAVPGRLRVCVPGLKGAKRLKLALEGALRSGRAVKEATASAATGTLLVLFDPKFTNARIIEAIEDALTRYRAGRLEPKGGQPRPAPWHLLDVDAALKRLRSSTKGLSIKAFESRLRRYGENALPAVPGRARMEILLEQFNSLPVALLIGAAALSLFTGGAADAVVVLSVVALNAGIGFVTENRAERAVRALSHPFGGGVPVIRDGKSQIVAIESTVPGDVLELRPGVIVAADARVIVADGLMVNEATLTGESAPVQKLPQPLPADVALADRTNIVYRGSAVTGGSGLAAVVATGAATEIGRLQSFLSVANAPETPLQKQLGRLGRQLTLIASGACVAVFFVGLLRGYGFFATLKNAVALAVAAIPEGLPTLATTTLALGVREMRRHHVLIRRLDAVETLASVEVACLDKTGTLTFNRMSVTEISCGGRVYRSAGDRICDDSTAPVRLDAAPCLKRLAQVVALCNEAPTIGEENKGNGPPSATEAALLAFSEDAGIDVAQLRRDYPLERVSYRTERQLFMTTLHKTSRGTIAAVKGSPEKVLGLCNRIHMGREAIELTDALRADVEKENARLASMGQRVLGAAYLEFAGDAPPKGALIFIGLIGLADPLRPGVAELLATLRRAGVSPVMITGDQRKTAEAVARALDLGNGELRIVDSDAIADLKAAPGHLREVPHVFARVTPGQKLEIVEALQRSGRVVAMTGDGVNDSPALKAADIGVAMGLSGSEAARDVAHIVLQDDRLQSLIPAIELGRATHANIRRAIRYLLATNMSEILLMLIAPAAGLGQPLTPAQLLWINLVTDVAPALALGLEPPHRDVLRAPPMTAHENIIDARSAPALARDAGLISAASFGSYLYGVWRYGASPRARTICFTNIVAAQLLHALACRSREHSIFSRELPPNRLLSAVVAGSLIVQAAISATPPIRRLLGIAPISIVDGAVALAAALAPLLVTELQKAARRRGDGDAEE
jgi:Ca2+-transporting ATPase